MCVNHIGKDPNFVAHDFTIDSTFATVNAGRPALKGTDMHSIHTEQLREEEPTEAQWAEEPGQ
ncbi:MAG: hypothetical protein QXO39_04045 [Conexivisphaerales archaeon]